MWTPVPYQGVTLLMVIWCRQKQRGIEVVHVWCSVLLWYCRVPRDGLCKNDITRMCRNRCAVGSGVMMDVDQRTECVSAKPQGCLSVFVCCLNYFSQMLPVIQTVSVYGNEYAKKTIKKTLNGHNFHLLGFFFSFALKLGNKQWNISWTTSIIFYWIQ